MTTELIIIVLLVALIGGAVALGWRSPDRSPGIDTKAERERIED